MLNPKYANKVKLLIKCLPSIASEECFAIKGGTAINLSLPQFTSFIC